MKRALKFILLPAACCILTLTLFRVFFFLGYVPTASMEPAIPEGSLIIADRTAYWRDTPKPGDVIVFEREGRILVKRVAAVSGDTVQRNGWALTIPEGTVYALGDNQNDSVDSQDWADPFIPIDSIIARYDI